MNFHKLIILLIYITGNATVLSIIAYYISNILTFTHFFKVGIGLNLCFCIVYLFTNKRINKFNLFGLSPIFLFLYGNIIALVNMFYFNIKIDVSSVLFHNLLPINIFIGYLISLTLDNNKIRLAIIYINKHRNKIFLNISVLCVFYYYLYITGIVVYWGVFTTFGVFGVYYIVINKRYYNLTFVFLLLFGKRSILVSQLVITIVNWYSLIKSNKKIMILMLIFISLLMYTAQIFQRFEYVQSGNLFESLDYYSSGRLSEIYYNLENFKNDSYKMIFGAGNGFKLTTLYIIDGSITDYNSSSVHIGGFVYIFNYGVMIGTLIYLSNLYCFTISILRKNKFKFFTVYYQYIFIAGHFGNLYYIDTLYWLSFFIILNKKNYKSA